MQVACQPFTLSSGLLAPAWHTRLLIVWLLGVPLLGLLLTPPASELTSIWQVYLPTVLASVAFATFVTRLGLGRSILPQLLGRAWRRTDLAWAFGLAALVLSIDHALMTTLGLPESASSHALMPHSAAQKAAWLMVAVVVGVSEELVYRGYLQTQLTALTRSAHLAVLLQALLFAVAHAEQGGSAVARFAFYALGFGYLAKARGSLWPGIVAHVGIDSYAALSG